MQAYRRMRDRTLHPDERSMKSKSGLPVYTRNILRTYRSAPEWAVASGEAWYAEARRWCERWNCGVSTAAGIVAALSPRASWASNLAMAEYAISGKPRGLSRAVSQCQRILAGEDPLDVLTGPKIRAFYRAILGDPNAVVIDRWATRIALGKGLSERKVKILLKSKERRDNLVQSYINAARKTGIHSPAQVQAITWVSFRGRVS